MTPVGKKLAGAALALCFAAPVLAGQTCQEESPSPEQMVQATQMAELTLTQLTAMGDDVALISRAGQDLSNYQTCRKAPSKCVGA